MGSKLRVVSWVLLTLVGALTLLGALASVSVAYFGDGGQLGGVAVSELALDEDAVIAFKARQGTAAAFAAGYALLFLIIVLLPYRKGEIWAWWAVLIGTLATTGLILIRISMLGTNLGLAAATIPLAVGVVALLLDAGRLKSELG